MRISFILLLLFMAYVLPAQDLPRGMSDDEESLLPAYEIPFHQFANRDYSSTFTPPSAPLRTMAEWEEVQGYMIAYTSYTGMLREIVRYGKQECRMYVLTNNTANTITDLANNGIDTNNITFLNAPFNSIWSRDYGHWSAYANNVDSLVFVDWIYNRPRPKDDTVPLSLARHMNVPIYHTTQSPYDLVHTGGNFMCDGMGTGFSSKLILEDNQLSAGFGVSHTAAEIDSIMSKFMGINRYIKMETLPYDEIHHIDMHMKLLDEETLIVGEYPAGVADGPQIEANLQYVLNNYKTPYGTDYRVFRIPMPDDNGKYPNTTGKYFTYTNASFINKTIIVPTYNIPEDTTALRIWREACPGYKVVGINSTQSIGSLGALHCITKEIGVSDPLLITHQRLRDTYNTINPYKIAANIQHRTGIANATLYYTTDTTTAYTAVSMSTSGSDEWQAFIPAQAAGTEVFYYIQANANSGKQQLRPITAPTGFYNFNVLGTTAINGHQSLGITNIFPNPSKGITCLEMDIAATKAVSINVFNALGKQVEHIYTGNAKPTGKYFISTENYAAGVYLIEVKTKDESFVKRLIVK